MNVSGRLSRRLRRKRSRSARQRVLVIGKDARTDAIAASCVASPSEPILFALSELPIPGLVAKCERVFTGSLTDVDLVVQVAAEVRPDLVIIGPEEPLAAGVVDQLTGKLGVPTFGPLQALAAIESSKSWTRQLLDRHGIPGNPEYRVFDRADGIRSYMTSLGRFVVKPDGLTGGKGVRVLGEHLASISDAVDYAESLVAATGLVEIEERLEGEEFSLQTITDGESFIHCPAVQDHKRAFEGDKGANTGGMGSYSCPDFSLPFLTTDELLEAQMINERVIAALRDETDIPYRGVIYGGFMVTADGLRLIEYNARFGDPEAMNVLPLLRADFVEVCRAAAAGELSSVRYSFAAKATVCKYVVPTAYPDVTPDPGLILVPDQQLDREDLKWFWAACAQRGTETYLTPSRAGAFVGIADSLAEAEAIAEDAAVSVRGPVRHRRDIGRAEVVDARVAHMKQLRGADANSIARLGDVVSNHAA
jgi:phosphoribosylamine---glycine ligase